VLPTVTAIISLASAQFWSDFQTRDSLRGRMWLRLCANKHRRNRSPRLESTLSGQISSHLVIAEELTGDVIDLEGTMWSSCPLIHRYGQHHLPACSVNRFDRSGRCGIQRRSFAFGRVQSTGETQEWIAALDKMESLKPRAVVAGHKRIGNEDSPRIIAESRKYIRDFERLAMTTTTAQELYDQMLKLYPGWLNQGAL